MAAQGTGLLIAQIAGAAAAVGGTTAALISGAKAQKAQEKADAVAQAQTELENRRNIRQAIARGRVQRAQLTAQGQAQTGGFASSSVQGALGSASTQEAANVGFANQTIAAGGAINRQLGRARNQLGNAATFQAVAALPTQFGFDPASIARQRASRPENIAGRQIDTFFNQRGNF